LNSFSLILHKNQKKPAAFNRNLFYLYDLKGFYKKRCKAMKFSRHLEPTTEKCHHCARFLFPFPEVVIMKGTLSSRYHSMPRRPFFFPCSLLTVR